MDKSLATHTGFRFLVRRARPADEPVVADFFKHVAPEDMRFRFLGAVKEVSHQRLVEMTRCDDPHIHNFVVFSQDGMLIAVATFATDLADRRGEVAICIREDHKHLGIGWELLAYIARFAEEHGIEIIQSIESRENLAAIEVERNLGFTVTTDPDDPTLVLVQRQLGGKKAV